MHVERRQNLALRYHPVNSRTRRKELHQKPRALHDDIPSPRNLGLVTRGLNDNATETQEAGMEKAVPQCELYEFG